MTIVVAGFESQEGFSSRAMKQALEGPPSASDLNNIGFRERRHNYLCALRRPHKAFVYADSLLSREVPAKRDEAQPATPASAKRVAAARTAMKITAVDLVLSVPDFDPNGYPTGRFHAQTGDTCGIAYAGDSNIYQLTAAKFRTKAAQLHYTWLPSNVGGRSRQARYAICEAGSPIDVTHPSNCTDAYDESINFADNELPCLSANTVLRVFRAAFDDALNDYAELEASNRKTYREIPVNIEFVLLIYCRATRQPVIYHVDYQNAYGPNLAGYKSRGVRVTWNSLAVLGMESARTELQEARESAIAQLKSIDSHIGCSVRAIVEREAEHGYVGGQVRHGILDAHGFRLVQ